MFLINKRKTYQNISISFPIEKKEIRNAILANKNNLNKIIKIVHIEIRKKKWSSFFKKK
jgi:dephospho-CoA kinase